MRLFFISSLFSGFNLLFSYYFSASNKGGYAQLITVLRGLVTIIPIAYLFSYLWKMTGLWLATPAAELVTLVVTLTIFILTRSKNKSLYPVPNIEKKPENAPFIDTLYIKKHGKSPCFCCTS